MWRIITGCWPFSSGQCLHPGEYMKGILMGIFHDVVSLHSWYECGKPHHVTLQYGVDKKDWEKAIGRLLVVESIYNCWDENVQALTFDWPNYMVPCGNKHPHMTISYKEGIPPVYSNKMLDGPHKKIVHRELYLFKVQFSSWDSR